MYEEEICAVAKAAKNKYELLKNNKTGYMMASIMAGFFVGFGVLLCFTVGGALLDSPARQLAMGAVFGVALSLCVIAGAELFTGNNFVMSMGMAKKTVGFGQTAKVWLASYIGNIVGTVLMAAMFVLSGLAVGETAEFMTASSHAKVGLSATELIFRGILCNMLVCSAVWCSFRAKSQTAALIMVFLCIMAFVTTGFEHSIANMTLLAVGLIAPAGEAITPGGAIYNVGFVTLGNMIGGILFIALPYILIGKKKIR